MVLINKMYEKEMINKSEFLIAEEMIAKKYCIKKDNIYRSNHLINLKKRVINMMQKEEVINEKDNNENKCVTTIRKEN
jgi:hypothetical protein